MGKNYSSVLLALTVLALALFGNKTPAAPPKEAKSRESWRCFVVAMLYAPRP